MNEKAVARKIAESLIKQCLETIKKTPEGKRASIICPVNEIQGTKKNKVRFSAADRNSPVGIILRGDPWADLNYTTAVAIFDCHEMIPWLVKVIESEL